MSKVEYDQETGISELQKVLERYAYHMTLYYGKPELTKEYQTFMKNISTEIANVREIMPEPENALEKYEREHTKDIVVIANSFSAEYFSCGSHQIELTINIDKDSEEL